MEYNVSVLVSRRDGEYVTLAFDYLNALDLAVKLMDVTLDDNEAI